MKKYALIGEKLGHSYSKLIHERFFELMGIDASYELMEISKDDKRSFEELFGGKYSGFNITIPYKQRIMEFISDFSEEVKAIGAVNTVVFFEDSFIGYNTDYYGLKLMLEKNMIDINGKSVVVLGTGGASRAVFALCRDLNAKEITAVSRTSKHIPGIKTASYDDAPDGDVLFNATPVGMYPKCDASPLENLNGNFEAVVDLIYNPYETVLIKNAKEKGIKAVNGLYMLAAQAVYSQCLWNGISFDADITDKIFSELKKNFEKQNF